MSLCELTAAHLRFRDEVRDFAQREIAPRAAERDAAEDFPLDLLRTMGEKGWLGIPFPEEYGGMGRDCRSYILALEEIAQVCPSTAIAIAAHCSLSCYRIYAHGSAEQKGRYLPPLLRGEKIGSFGLTQPHA
ncbi:MAG: acyl-CoA dehydrogenase family protein, partial [Calditrichaeota bacterium]|nr:acyl-CoA dehydrogenase family protein [Calditrichota bacterium]